MLKKMKSGDTTTIVACIPLGVKGIFIFGKYGKSTSLPKWREGGDRFAILKTVKVEDVSTNIFRFSKSVNILEKGVDFV